MKTETALITGASRGLGHAFAGTLAAEGWRVFAGERNGSLAVDALSAKYPGKVSSVALDVADLGNVKAAAEMVARQTGSLDLLINNAAINYSGQPESIANGLDYEAARRFYDVNALGPLRVAEAFLPLLQKGHAATVLQISSESGSLGGMHAPRSIGYEYCMSKAAMNMGGIMLHRHLQPLGMRVIIVHPGWINTDMGGASAPLSPEESARAILDLLPKTERLSEYPHFLSYDGESIPW